MKAKKPVIGCLYGVGVGPGDPELLTLRACRILSRVPVVFVPQKDGESSGFARSIISGVIKSPPQRTVDLVFPMIRDRAQLAAHWKQAVDTIWEQLADGNDCAFVNVGDPLLYGTFVHVFDMLREYHPDARVEAVPGISSVSAAAARTLTSLASNNERVAIVSAADSDDFIRETLKSFDTVVFLKLPRPPDRLLDILAEMGLTEKSVYVRRCTTPDEQIVRDITRLRGASLDYFSLVLVRK